MRCFAFLSAGIILEIFHTSGTTNSCEGARDILLSSLTQHFDTVGKRKVGQKEIKTGHERLARRTKAKRED